MGTEVSNKIRVSGALSGVAVLFLTCNSPTMLRLGRSNVASKLSPGWVSMNNKNSLLVPVPVPVPPGCCGEVGCRASSLMNTDAGTCPDALDTKLPVSLLG
ncbi:MAG: hypothetical protein EBT70_08485 [Betaproteobacteria bacterium]|nr:hypothetical protein [Betaproteobacteria bacterium]